MSTASSEKMEVVMSSKLVHLPPSTLNHHSAQQTEQDLWFRFPSQVSLRAVNRCSFLNLTYTQRTISSHLSRLSVNFLFLI